MKRDLVYTDELWENKETTENRNTIIKGSLSGTLICEVFVPIKGSEDIPEKLLIEEQGNINLIKNSGLMYKKLCYIEDVLSKVISGKTSILDLKPKEELKDLENLLNRVCRI